MSESFLTFLRLFQVPLHEYPGIRFNRNGHRGMLPRAALRGKLVQSTGGIDFTISRGIAW